MSIAPGLAQTAAVLAIEDLTTSADERAGQVRALHRRAQSIEDAVNSGEASKDGLLEVEQVLDRAARLGSDGSSYPDESRRRSWHTNSNQSQLGQ